MGKRNKQVRRIRRKQWNVLTALDAANFQAEIAGSNAFEKTSLAALPTSIRAGMPGITEVYVSRSLDQPSIQNGLVYLGKLIVGRYDSALGKGYVFAYALSASRQIVYCELDKHPTAHHWPSGSPPPVVVLANDTPLPLKIYDA